MKIHKEGIHSIFIISLFNVAIFSIAWYIFPYFTPYHFILYAGLIFLEFFVIQFFKYPTQAITNQNNSIISPAQGTVVVIEEIDEQEYFKEKMIQISVFMSIWDTHLNRVPISGKLIYKKYYPGRHFIARYPKSSVYNERNSLVIESPKGHKIMVKQIAGIMARRIVNYFNVGDKISQGEQLGFIKFGSRVDIILPKTATIHVKLGQRVQCGKTTIAEL